MLSPLYLADATAPMVTAPEVTLRSSVRLSAGSIPVTVSWTAKDPSGVAAVVLEHRVGAGEWSPVPLPKATARKINLRLDPSKRHRFRVRAIDGAGNTSAWALGERLRINSRRVTNAAIVYGSGWQKTSSPGALGGSLKFTTKRSSATFSFTGSSIVWVAPVGPKRGVAKVRLDGKLVATIDLRANSNKSRRAVFSASWVTSGSHTLKIVTLATAGRPRIDIDSLLVLRPD